MATLIGTIGVNLWNTIVLVLFLRLTGPGIVSSERVEEHSFVVVPASLVFLVGAGLLSRGKKPRARSWATRWKEVGIAYFTVVALQMVGWFWLGVGSARDLLFNPFLTVALGSSVNRLFYRNRAARARSQSIARLTYGEDWRRTGRLKIGLYRRFDDVLAPTVRERLIPAIAAYGDIDLLVDDAIRLVTPDDFFGVEYDEVFLNTSSLQPTHDSRWRASAIQIMEDSDVVVFDLSMSSRNVRWEIKTASELVPLNRILFVSRYGTRPDVTLLSRFPRLAALDGRGGLKRPIAYDSGSLFHLRLWRWMRQGDRWSASNVEAPPVPRSPV